MQKGRGGMGSHKHGVSGHAGKSPRFREAAKREAEKNEKRHVGLKEPAESVKDLLSKRK